MTEESGHLQEQLSIPGLEKGEWDFADAPTQYGTHGLHPYPARMIPQVANKLLKLYLLGSKARSPIVLDPFCGSGTVLVEAARNRCFSIGIDLNPFAVLLARAKASPVEVDAFEKVRSSLQVSLTRYTDSRIEQWIPHWKNLRHWFKEDVINKLAYIRKSVALIERADMRRLAQVAFSLTMQRASNVDWRSSRYIRILPQEELDNHDPDVFMLFGGALSETQRKLDTFAGTKMWPAVVLQGDARTLPLKSNSIDLVITSPPYGEERNTIPYIRWSKLSLWWLGLIDSRVQTSQLEAQSLGGKGSRTEALEVIPAPTFWKAVEGVSDKRLNEAVPFIRDYLITLQEIRRVLKPSGRACIVIGHRSISRRLIDMGEVTRELGEAASLQWETAHFREIPKKMIPWTTPTGKTISTESIVVLRRE